MARTLVNGVEYTGETPCKHWGELLERLDTQCSVHGQVLTAVRFDGVDEPSFREPDQLSRPLAGLAVIEAESASPRQLFEDSLDEASAAARTLAQAAERVGGAFRGFEVTAAQGDLAELAQGMGTLVAIAQALGQGIGVELKAVTCGQVTGADMVDQLIAHADVLIDAQQSEDWITVADVIEYDIAPALGQWPALFEALRASIPSTAAAS
jgi:hypothetical protein